MRRLDRVCAAAGSCRQMRLADAWRIPSAGDFQHTLSRSCGRLWPRPPFELALYSAEVREGSYPNEPHLRVTPFISMVPRSRRVPPFVLCLLAPFELQNISPASVCTAPVRLCSGAGLWSYRTFWGVACGRIRRDHSSMWVGSMGGLVGARV